MEKEFHRFEDSERFEMQDLKQTIGTRQGQSCIFYEERVLDRRPATAPHPLHGRARGFVCLHPSFPKTVVYADCSERGLENELSESLLKEGQAVREGVQLDSAPGRAIAQNRTGGTTPTPIDPETAGVDPRTTRPTSRRP